MQLDNFTFGDSAAEITLAKILTERGDQKAASYASRLLAFISKRWKSVKIAEPGTRKYLYGLVRADVFQKIDSSIHFIGKPDIRTYLKNAATKRLRKFI
jgi:hypothetical protein